MVADAVELFGCRIVIDLPRDPARARERLLDAVEEYLEAHPPNALRNHP